MYILYISIVFCLTEMCICVLGQGSESSKDKNTTWLVKDLSDSQGSLRGGTADGAQIPSDIHHCNGVLRMD